MKMKAPVLVSMAAAISLFSCKKEATNEASSNSSIAYQLKASNPSAAIGKLSSTARTEAVSVQWTSGTANATLIKFEAKSASGEVEFKQNTQQSVDLFAASSVLGNISIPQGTYSEVEFKAMLAPSGNTPALQISGTITNGSVTMPVRFVVNAATELKAEKNNVTVAQGTTLTANNSIDLSLLTSGLSANDINNAVLTNGTLIISSNSNAGIYATILNNLSSHHGEAEIEHH